MVPNVGDDDIDDIALERHQVAHHQSAESLISDSRLRFRLRNQTPTTETRNIRPSPAPSKMEVDAQPSIVLDVHSFADPSMATNPTTLIASFIAGCGD